jgi:hypothetical protein
MKKYKTKEETVQTFIWNKNFDDIYNFMDADKNYGIVGYKKNVLKVRTEKGFVKANIGDYIIKSNDNQFYVCNSDLFNFIYNEIN